MLIFHIFDPHIRTPRQGVGLQVVTPKGTVVTNCSDVSSFRADSHSLDLRNFFPSGDENKDFFRLSEQRASGRATSTNGERLSAVFDFDILPTVGWGETLLADTETTSSSSSSEQFSTAGWLSAFPVFEPHYQVLISKGTTMGSLTLKEEHDEGSSEFAHYDLDGATMYLEKNWGRSFPSRWWWIQANTFVENKNLSITSTAARRQLPFLRSDSNEEEVGLVGVHWNGKFFPFPVMNWEVSWGSWKVYGNYGKYKVELVGRCGKPGIPVLCPTSKGMEAIAWETFDGTLDLSLYENDQLILKDRSCEACLEVGGLPWSIKAWKGESAMKEPIKSLVMDETRERQFSKLLQVFSAFVEIPGL